MTPPLTPDQRYIVVDGRLWRSSNPHLPAARRDTITHELMRARRAVKTALAAGNRDALAVARADVQAAKEALGERGPVWWDDDSPDLNRKLIRNTPYADWWQREGDGKGG